LRHQEHGRAPEGLSSEHMPQLSFQGREQRHTPWWHSPFPSSWPRDQNQREGTPQEQRFPEEEVREEDESQSLTAVLSV
jgi:hypothetical protein